MSEFGKAIFCFIKTTLERYELPASDSAINLLIMIMAHESGNFRYVKQKDGPALGLCQMEHNTFFFVMGYLIRTERFKLLERHFPPELMQVDSAFALAVARVYLYSFPESLPDANDFEGLACYAKKYWNTTAGKATEQDYLNAFNTVRKEYEVA